MPVADWGTATVGRLVLREGFTLTASVDGTTGYRMLAVSGEESSPPLTLTELKRRQEDILGLQGRFVPIIFTNKADHNGWYLITDANSEVTNWTGEVAKFTWTINARRIGAERSVDLESRSMFVVRSNNYAGSAQAGERWHAPAAGATGYYTGPTQPSLLSRASADGTAITVARVIPAGVSPRWSSSLAAYAQGRARILVNTVERVAVDVAIATSDAWELNNGLIKVNNGASATLLVSSWDGTQWERVDWNASSTASASGPITAWDAVSIIRNDYEAVTLRLMKDRAPGRVTLDLSMRRGSRFVETYLQADTATILSWYRAITEAGTAPASAGYVAATANDAGGNQYIVGSAKVFTAQTAVGGLTLASTRTLDAYLGAVLNGTSAVAGDQAANLQAQYIVSQAEAVMGVSR